MAKIWTGSITFGLVEIPAELHGAEVPDELAFRFLDRRDLSPVGNQRINKNTGQVVPWEEVVRGYEYEKGAYVVLGDEDLRRANPKMSRVLEITEFVAQDEIDPMHYEKPYYLLPARKDSKSYALLRAALQAAGKVGIGKLVLRTRERLAAIVPRDGVLAVIALRFAHELRKPEDIGVSLDEVQETKAAAAEVKLAEKLIEGMTGPWKPERHRDTYREDVLAMVEKKVKAGKVAEIEEPAEEEKPRKGKVIDLMALLKESLEKTGRAAAPAAARKRRKQA